MPVEISSAAVDQIIAAAARAMPREACGLLLGDRKRISTCSEAANVAANPYRHFEIEPEALFAALHAERAGGDKLLGYWHSHPYGDPSPSETDLAMAPRDGRLWLIVAGERVRLWRAPGNGWRAGGFEAVEFRIF